MSRSHLGPSEVNSGRSGHTLGLVKCILADGRAAVQCALGHGPRDIAKHGNFPNYKSLCRYKQVAN